MYEKPADFLEKSRFVFVDHPGVTLQDVVALVEKEAGGIARRDRLSALSAVQNLWKQDLARIPASEAGLIQLFRGRRGPELGVSQKRFQNIKSGLSQLVRSYGVVKPSLTSRIPLSPAWKALMGLIEVRSYAHGLQRYACFCSAVGVEPDQAGAAHILLSFHEALRAEAAVKDPKVTLRLTITYWNNQSRRIPGWPAIRLHSPFPSKAYILPLRDFPESFSADLAAWADAQTKRRKFGEAGIRRAKRPATIKSQTAALRRFASFLVKEGLIAPPSITGLDIIVEPEMASQGLELLWKKAGETATGQLRNLARLLRTVGRYYVKLPDEQDKILKNCCDYLGRNSRGMTSRNRDRLRQFDDRANLVSFLNYPYELMRQLDKRQKGKKPLNLYREAKVCERAAAAAILIYSRVRMRNLHTIKLETNLLHRGDHCVLSYTEEETKNRNVLQLELPKEATKLVRTFIEKHRKHLPGSDGPFLFPGQAGGPRPASTMAQDFRLGVKRITGLTVNPHLVRHIIGIVVSNHDPAMVTAVSQALGHADFQTTLDFYLPNQALASSRAINRLLEEKVAAGLRRARPHRGRL